MSRPNLYDYLKILAIILMIIDHIGYFLYPDVLRLRVIGRLAFPIFFFLIGRNGSSRISYELIFLACFVQWILRWASIFMWYNLRQLNILPVAILTKVVLWCISQSKVLTLRHYEEAGINTIPTKQSIKVTYLLLCIMIIFILCSPFAKWIMEYGLIWFVMAIFGYIIRHKEIIWNTWIYSAGSLSLISCVTINNSFPFSFIQWLVVITGLILLWYIFYTTYLYSSLASRSHSSTSWLSWFWDPVKKIVLWFSTHAVRVYVLHFSILLTIVIFRKR